MRKLVLFLCLVGLVAACPGVSQAQVEVGGVVAWHDDADLGLGARVTFPLESIAETVSGVGEFLFFFPDDGGGTLDVSYWELNGNLLYEFAVESASFVPYAGAGINVAYYSFSFDNPFGDFGDFDDSTTDIGINILGGAALEGRSVNPFIEGRIELGGGEAFVITAGASVSLGGDQ